MLEDANAGGETMNRIWVVAGYEKEPVEHVRSDLMKRAGEMMQRIFPQSHVRVETETGSWRLIVAVACATGTVWLLDVIGKWAVSRCLDHFAAVIRKDNTLLEQETVNLTTMSNDTQWQETQSGVSFDDKLNQCAVVARELNRGAPLQVLNIAEWNDEREEGVLIQFKLDGEMKAMSFVKCQNIADLQRLMRL
jgi:hypothetical protein